MDTDTEQSATWCRGSLLRQSLGEGAKQKSLAVRKFTKMKKEQEGMEQNSHSKV
jgi:hypothetical protein